MSTTKEKYPKAPETLAALPLCGREQCGSPALHAGTYLAPRLPLMMGAVTTLLPFIGWLITDSGTVILVGSFP